MPALPNVPQVIRFDVGWQIEDDLNALTRLHCNYSGTAPSSATCVTLAHDFHTIVVGTLLPYVGTHINLLSVEATDLTSPTAGQGIYKHTDPGTFTGTRLAAGVAGLASMVIARRYRGGKPRSYLPVGVAEALQTQQTWQASFISNVQASLDAIRSDIAVTSASGCALGTLVNVSYYQGFTVVTNPGTGRARNVPKLRTGGPVVDAALNWVFENRVASQRRRNLRSS